MIVTISKEKDSKRRILELPCDDRSMARWMRTLGCDSVSPSLYLHKVRDDDGALQHLAGNIVNVDELNLLARRLEELAPDDRKKYAAMAEYLQIKGIRNSINLTYSLQDTVLLEWGSDIIKLQVLSPGHITKNGLLYLDGWKMNEIYNGITFPESDYEPEATALRVHISHASLDEWISFPTDHITVGKVVNRLGAGSLKECRVEGFCNGQLPESIYDTLKNDICTLDYLNEFCRCYLALDKTDRIRVEMAAEYAGPENTLQLTGLIKNLENFEFIEGIQNLEEYGAYHALPDGGEWDTMLLKYIDFKQYATEKMEAAHIGWEFIEKGFIGASHEAMNYMNYSGEQAAPLEEPEDAFELLKLYSPLKGRLYDGDYIEDLEGFELLEHEHDIKKALHKQEEPEQYIKGLMSYFRGSGEVSGKVFSAKPNVEEQGGSLYGVLECRIREELTEEELEELKSYWSGQASDGWGERFEQRAIDEKGSLFLSFWNNAPDYEILTEQEMQQNGQEFGMC